jgi:uncharacterized protein (TIGR02599 family)
MTRSRHVHPAPSVPAFTLVELLVAMTAVSILLLVCTSALDQTQDSWLRARSSVDQFREPRIAFETISRHLAQAELNTYWDYYYAETESNEAPEDVSASPSAYVRHSELQFQSGSAPELIGGAAPPSRYPGHAVFFQAPLGLSQNHPGLGNLLNARGYYVEFGSDDADKPPFIVERGLPAKHRYRLMEYRPPAEHSQAAGGSFQGNTIYTKPADWFRQDLSTSSRVVAENILLLLVSPRGPQSSGSVAGREPWWIAPRYDYDSLDCDNSSRNVEGIRMRDDGTADQGTQHLLPPIVELTMVAIDEPSAQRWTESRKNSPVSILQDSGAAFANVVDEVRDMKKLKDYLVQQKLNYHVFTASVALRNARWDGSAF